MQKSNDAHFDDEIKNISDLDDDSGEIESTTESEESTYPKNCSGTPTTSSNFGSDQWSLDSNEKKIERDNEDYDSGTKELIFFTKYFRRHKERNFSYGKNWD